MAYSNLLSLENTIDQILLDHDRFSICPHEKKQIVSLDKCVIFCLAFLEDYPEKAKIVEARIRDVAVGAENVLEWFMQEQMPHCNRFTEWIAKLRGIMFIYQLNKVRYEMDLIVDEVVEVTNSIIIEDGDPVEASSSSQVADTRNIEVVGFNKDLIEIKEKLCGWATQLQILPISGMGGIGKTTLARNAYDDQLIMEHFQVRVWVTVSQDYTMRRILLDLLDSMKEFNQKSTTEDPKQCNESPEEIPELSNSEMAIKVHKILMVRRFLIVMDDIWSIKVLDDVKHLFPNSNNGSRIMLTTRLTEVATYANSTTLPHEMRLMDLDQSWNLLRQKVFVHQDRIPRELESIGREIARSCGGLPLAIVVIAGLLSTASETPTSWEEVARNIRSSLVTTDVKIEKILSLSYNHLPHRLRPCLLYMGGFPEDHRIKVTHLIRLWLAESLVKPIKLERSEDTAEEYLQDLVDRNLVIVTKRKSNGKIKSCRLHDMVREMCIKQSQEEKFLLQVNNSQASELLKSMKDLRRISISHSDLNSFSNIYSSTIRTIMYFQDALDSFGGFRLLRVLDLLRARSQSKLLSDLFFELFHLRYLALCNSNTIPRTISHLHSLQTLVINEISDSHLPCEIWNMKQLRHLVISKMISLPDTKGATSTLENLHTLAKVKNLRCSIATLNLIPNLTKLSLTYSRGSGELLFHNLVHLSRLEKLHLELQVGWRDSCKTNLVVPSSLKKLTLIGWGYFDPYLEIVGPFPNLEVLKLKKFEFKQQVWRTNDEDFPQLKHLYIEQSNLAQWETESSHFPRLKALVILVCQYLNEMPDCIGEIPTLELIVLRLCTVSLAKSAKLIQEEALNCDDDAFQVRCIGCTLEESRNGLLLNAGNKKLRQFRQVRAKDRELNAGYKKLRQFRQIRAKDCE